MAQYQAKQYLPKQLILKTLQQQLQTVTSLLQKQIAVSDQQTTATTTTKQTATPVKKAIT